MVLQRFYNDRLAHASYLVGCPAAGEAIIIDPNRNTAQYIEAAAAGKMRITGVAETHIHADFLSGSKELAEATGATLYLSDEGPEDWKYAFAQNATLVKSGYIITAGSVKLEVVHTPGHTPEHISFVLIDGSRGDDIAGVFSGDFVFVGDVGRPDLLEQAAGIKGTQEPGARDLYRSLQWFKNLPDHALVWPAHGAGSPCGRALGAVPVSSVGYEKLSNWALLIGSEDAFVAEVLRGQPEPPAYYAQMKTRNKVGPAQVSGRPHLVRLADPTRFITNGSTVVDVRASDDYLANHVRGAFHIPLNQQFTINAGWFLPYDTDLLLVAADEASARLAAQELSMVGLDQAVAWAGPDILGAARSAGGELRTIPSLVSTSLPAGLRKVDVRGASENESDPSGSDVRVPLGFLPRRLSEFDPRLAYAVHCQGGVRSPVAVSVLEHYGIENLVDVSDGWMGMKAAKA